MDEPYWKNAVPGSVSPTLIASDVESPVPQITGVPSASPVWAAASLEYAQAAIWSGLQ